MGGSWKLQVKETSMQFVKKAVSYSNKRVEQKGMIGTLGLTLINFGTDKKGRVGHRDTATGDKSEKQSAHGLSWVEENQLDTFHISWTHGWCKGKSLITAVFFSRAENYKEVLIFIYATVCVWYVGGEGLAD